jgi:transcriptional regulator with XRE-family HTH domain
MVVVTSVGGTSMGEVIALGKKRPNGAKIVQLRKERGMKQEALAKAANEMSVRLLRDIEKLNRPVPVTTITAIATALRITPDEITLSTPDGTPASSVPRLKLTAVRSATELSALTSGTTDYEWELQVDPTTVTAPDMQALMVIVSRLVAGEGKFDVRVWDQFDQQAFPQIPRLARLHELLAKLLNEGVGVIAGRYARRSLKKTKDAGLDSFCITGNSEWSIEYEYILCLHFVPAENQESDIPINPGKSMDDLKKEAERLDFEERERSVKARRDDMDDEIPL